MAHEERSRTPPTPRVQRTLARAAQIARDRGHSYLGTEHLLIALLDDADGIAGQVLNRESRGTSIRGDVEEIMASATYRTPSRHVIPPGTGLSEI